MGKRDLEKESGGEKEERKINLLNNLKDRHKMQNIQEQGTKIKVRNKNQDQEKKE